MLAGSVLSVANPSTLSSLIYLPIRHAGRSLVLLHDNRRSVCRPWSSYQTAVDQGWRDDPAETTWNKWIPYQISQLDVLYDTTVL